MALLLCGTSGLVFGVQKKYLRWMVGLGLILVLGSGFLTAATIYPDLRFPLWVYFKFLIWLPFLALVFLKNVRELKGAIFLVLILSVLEIYLGVYRPTFKSADQPAALEGMSNGPPPAAHLNQAPEKPGNQAPLPGPPPFGPIHGAPPPAKPYKPPVPAR